MNVFKKIKAEIARQLAHPPEVETEQSWNLGEYFESEMDEEDFEEFKQWKGIGGHIFTNKIEGKDFWFRYFLKNEEE